MMYGYVVIEDNREIHCEDLSSEPIKLTKDAKVIAVLPFVSETSFP